MIPVKILGIAALGVIVLILIISGLGEYYQQVDTISVLQALEQ